MKRGFTLIEIIISISLVLIIGTSATFIIVKNNSNNNLEKVTNQMLEAANAYIKTEVDNDGYTYAKGINSGAKGAIVPLTELVNEGYVKESLVQDLEELVDDGKPEEQSYYVMMVSENEYCDTGEITSIPSWVRSDETIYLCDKVVGSKEETKTLSEHILESYGSDYLFSLSDRYTKVLRSYEYPTIINDYCPLPGACPDTMEISSTYYNFFTSPIYQGLITGAYGLDSGYHFQGSVENNYVKIGNIIFRILSFNENQINLVLNNIINVSPDSSIGTIYTGSNSYMNITNEDSYINKSIKNYFVENVLNQIGLENVNHETIDKFYYNDNNFSYSQYTADRSSFDLARLGTYKRAYGMLDFYTMRLTGAEIIPPHYFEVYGLGISTEIEDVYINSYLNFSEFVSVDIRDEYDYELNCYYEEYVSETPLQYSFAAVTSDNKILEYDYGTVTAKSFSETLKIRPVLSLNVNNISWSGHGTYGSPYVITYKG